MPKDTFLNLNKKKQKVIFDACVQEFSKNTFSLASINQIIKTANISRGSFYQYFNDKEDCYMYVLSEIAQVKLDILKQSVVNSPEQSFFKHIEVMIDQTLLWVKQEPDYYMIGYWMDYDDSEFIQKLMAYNTQNMEYFKKMIQKDQQDGIISKNVDVDLLIRMILSINKDILMEGYRKKEFDLVKKQFMQMMQIIKEGAAHVWSKRFSISLSKK